LSRIKVDALGSDKRKEGGAISHLGRGKGKIVSVSAGGERGGRAEGWERRGGGGPAPFSPSRRGGSATLPPFGKRSQFLEGGVHKGEEEQHWPQESSADAFWKRNASTAKRRGQHHEKHFPDLSEGPRGRWNVGGKKRPVFPEFYREGKRGEGQAQKRVLYHLGRGEGGGFLHFRKRHMRP